MKLKRLISCILSAVLILMSFGAVPAFAANEQDVFTDDDVVEYNDNIGFLKAIGVMPADAEYDISRTVTRAEMIKVLMQVFGIPAVSYVEGESPYSDVTAETPEYGYIMAATQKGIVHGDGGVFRPNDKVLYEEASKIVVSMLGYGFLAEEAGGFPQGYIYKAQQLGLLAPTVGYSNYAMGWFGFARMIAAAVKTDMMMATVNSSGDIKYVIEEGANILTDILKLDTVEGVVTRNIYSKLTASDDVIEDAISIGTKNYKTACDTRELLGCNVKAYANKDDEIIFIEDHSKYNNIMTFDADEISYSNFAYEYEVNDRAKTVKIPTKFNLIWNNKARTNFTEAELLPKDGYVTLIDADNDNLFETVKVYDYHYMMIQTVDATEEVIYGKHNADKVDLSKAKILEITDNNGKEKAFTELNEYTILKVVASEDGEIIFIDSSTMKVKGVVNGVFKNNDKKTVRIGGGDYDAISTTLGNEISGGDSGVLYLSADGKAVAFIKGNPSGTTLGVLLATAKGKGLKDNLKIKVYTENGVLSELDCAEKVKIDGVRKENADDMVTILKKGLADLPAQPVLYTVNEEGLVSIIDTAYGINSVGKNTDESDDSLRQIFDGSAHYMATQGTFSGKLNLSDSTKVFSIPTDYATADAKKFSVGGMTSLSNDADYTFTAYSSSDTELVADVLITNAATSKSGTYAVVRSITEKYDADTQEARMEINLTSWNRDYKLYTDDEELVKKAPSTNSADTTTYSLDVGDFVVFTYGAASELDTIKLVVDASAPADQRFKGKDNPTTNDFSSKDRMLYGKVDINYKGIIAIEKGTETENCNTAKFKVYKYTENRNGGSVDLIKGANIYDVKTFGPDADYVLMYSDWAESRIIVVY